jgi:hypothetical protein
MQVQNAIENRGVQGKFPPAGLKNSNNGFSKSIDRAGAGGNQYFGISEPLFHRYQN